MAEAVRNLWVGVYMRTVGVGESKIRVPEGFTFTFTDPPLPPVKVYIFPSVSYHRGEKNG